MRRPALWFCLLLMLCGLAIGLRARRLAQDEPEASRPPALPAVESAAQIAGWVRFADVAAAAGLHYRWTVAGKRPFNILQTIGNGCAFLDYNNDGNLDILLVGPKLALYQGDGHGHFTDVTHATGLDKLHGHFLGCAVGDYDNDGYDDLYISGYQTGILLHNEALTYPPTPSLKGRGDKHSALRLPLPSEPASVLGKGAGGLGRHFRDVTAAMGLKAQPWGTSCAFADLDGDGFLDLYVCNYVAFNPASIQLCQRDGIVTACDPGHYPSLKGVLYHNLGGHGFQEVTQAWGLDSQTGNGLGVAAADMDGSGRISLALANDEPGDDLFQNQGGGRFQNISTQAGTRGDRQGNKHAGMGVDWGDYDNDGRLDFFVTTFQNEAKCLYHNEGNGLFTEQSAAAGIETRMMALVSFGCKFLDVDNAGRLDLLIASGHVEDNVEESHRGMTYREPLKLLYNAGDAHGGGPVQFQDMRRGAGLDKIAPIVGRGLAVGDFDNDGRMDALVVDSEGVPLLLHNESKPVGHWIGFRLVGSGRSNRDAYGAVITVFAGGRRLMRDCHADGSYLSSSDKRVQIGLGHTDKTDGVTIRWPDGVTETRTHLATDRYMDWIERGSRN